MAVTADAEEALDGEQEPWIAARFALAQSLPGNGVGLEVQRITLPHSAFVTSWLVHQETARSSDPVTNGRQRRGTIKLLRDQLDGLKKRITQIETDPASVADAAYEIDQLKRAKRAWLRRIMELREEKYVLNVLTDASVLPNYAFPEPGVHLQSVLREPPPKAKRPTKGGLNPKVKATYRQFEYVRPAASAMRELAPFNTFYAEGHKVEVNEVHLGHQGNLLESWRFCANCHHMERDLGGVDGGSADTGNGSGSSGELMSCPRCGDGRWGDKGQVRTMVPFRIARSIGDLLESTTVDDTEERRRSSYRVHDIIDVGPDNLVSGARVIESLPLGYEFLANLPLRQVNFGSSQAASQSFHVAGFEVPEDGFEVCVSCGRLRDARRPDELRHAPYCKAGRGTFADQQVGLFLYREVRSEALRILLPLAEMDVDKGSKSFKAALEYGFRRKFEGRPIHLLIRKVSEPISPESKLRKRYLVVYDAVPGGTGYLKELQKDNGVFELLSLAYEGLRRCRCRLDHRDGCYRCLYAYQNQQDLDLISSKVAEDVIGQILRLRGEVVERASLSDVSLSERLESELELRFVQALERQAERDGYQCSVTVHEGEKCHLLSFGATTWRLEPQVSLGVADGVGINTRPDFILRPVTTPASARPVAVYCDSIAFHVQPKREIGRIADDIGKRQAILGSGRYWVWSVSGRDRLDQTPRFYLEEWDQVVQAQDISDVRQYLRARRQGRGTRLSRGQRLLVWGVFKEYRENLNGSGRVEMADLVREARLFLQKHAEARRYRCVLADEAPDLTANDMKLLRAMVEPAPNDVFLVGDAHQRIYGYPVVMSRCGLEIRGRSRRLRVNYRTTEQVRRWAVSVLADLAVDDLDGGSDTLAGYYSLRVGSKPVFEHFETAHEEGAYIAEMVRGWIAGGYRPEEICVTARTRALVEDHYRPVLEQHGIATTIVDSSAPEKLREGVRVATMHRMKGLEFPLVVASVRDGVVPFERMDRITVDEASQAHEDQLERRLMYVSATRARDELVITGFGARSRWFGVG